MQIPSLYIYVLSLTLFPPSPLCMCVYWSPHSKTSNEKHWNLQLGIFFRGISAEPLTAPLTIRPYLSKHCKLSHTLPQGQPIILRKGVHPGWPFLRWKAWNTGLVAVLSTREGAGLLQRELALFFLWWRAAETWLCPWNLLESRQFNTLLGWVNISLFPGRLTIQMRGEAATFWRAEL